ncbi:MAG: hypothetical protein Q8P18_29890 [Pseudomonadota bacterium]|nr:hypothetical protein [Pseudomonadota bacterium]
MTLLLLLACAGTSDQLDDTAPSSDTDTDTDSDSDTDTDEPPVDADQRAENLASGPGDYAADFLAGTYTSLQIEVDYVAGHAPDGAALEHLRSTLAELCDKPDGVEILLDDEVPDQGSPAWSYATAQALEVTWRDRYRSPDTGVAVMYYLYVDGHSESDTEAGRILGYAYHGSSLVMFAETMADVSGGLLLGLGASVEPTVLVHEAGHLLGLVNNGVDMVEDHQDTAHGHHDVSEDCIMFWAAETDAIGDLLGAGTPDFDAECRADMRAAGGR